RCVEGLSPTSTMLALPASSRWVSRGASDAVLMGEAGGEETVVIGWSGWRPDQADETRKVMWPIIYAIKEPALRWMRQNRPWLMRLPSWQPWFCTRAPSSSYHYACRAVFCAAVNQFLHAE